jgi:16S rRNA processing protein RimM
MARDGDGGINHGGHRGHRVSSPEFITVARVIKTQGRRGEVAVETHSDIAGRFKVGSKLSVLTKDDSRHELEIEDVWPHKRYLILKFAGIDSIADAEPLVECELQVSRTERSQLGPGWTYVSDLVGCKVFEAGHEIGKIIEVRLGAGEAPLLIVEAGEKKYEIPYAEAYLQSVDLNGRRIKMMLPDGLLELDAPLTAEEKEQQRKQSE